MKTTSNRTTKLSRKKSISHNSIHPGEILQEFYFTPLKLTIEKASKKTGISKSDLSAIVNKKANITANIAAKLAKAFRTTARYWLNMQQSYNASLNKNPRTKKEKLKAIKMVSGSDVRKRQMKQANDPLGLYPSPSNTEIKRDPVAISFFRFKNDPSVGNALQVIQMIKENTVTEILAKLKRHKELIKYGRKVFGDDKTFLRYLFSEPRALGNKMPIEFLIDDKGVQVIIDELGRIEYGIYS